MVDAVTLEVVRNGLAAVAEEMTATLVRTAYSPNITDRRDCSCALFTPSGEMVSQAETIPVHLGAMPHSVRAVLDRFPAGELDPGDSVLVNDPFHGGAHLPDLTLVSPIHVDGTTVGLVANRAHHADIGGFRAGSVAPDVTDIYGEGIRLPPVKVVRRGERNEALVEVLLANVRTPSERRGDLRAQEAANRTGQERFEALLDRHGQGTVRSATDELLAYSDRRMRAAIGDLPDGTVRFDDVLDDDGQGAEELPIAVELTVEDDTIRVDFSGSAEQTRGPVNAPIAVTTSATYYAVRAFTDPTIPANAGCYRAIGIDAPEGSIVNATPPAAVVGGNLETAQRIVDVVLGALGEAAPDRAVAASQGTMNNLTIGGINPRTGEPFTLYETQGGGAGGGPAGDGMDAVHVHMSNTRNTPVEVLETAFPLRVREYSIRSGSGGEGEYRGGHGLRRDIEVRCPATVGLLADRRQRGPYGCNGGDPGEPGADRIVRDGTPKPVPAKSAHELDPGDIVSIRTPGGGGYGDPADRDPAAIDRDRIRELGSTSTTNDDREREGEPDDRGP